MPKLEFCILNTTKPEEKCEKVGSAFGKDEKISYVVEKERAMLKDFKAHQKAVQQMTGEALNIILMGVPVMIVFPEFREGTLSTKILTNMDQETQEQILLAVADTLLKQEELLDEANDLLDNASEE